MDIGYYKQNEPYFGEWYITRLLGKGGYGKVFEIERKDPFSKTTYKAAMKIITVPANTQELNSARLNGMDDVSLTSYFHSMVERFVSEFDLMYKLKGNSNIVGYEDHRVVKHADGIGWDIQIKMELLTPVTEFFSNPDNSNRNNIIKLGIDMCRALEVCQSHKIIHRDIKPSNIFVSDNGDFKLGDFGVSRIKETTGTNLTKTGTIGYMAPEVYLGKMYDFSADIYSLGIVMYRLLNNNRLPFFPPISQPITVDDEEFALKSRIRGDKMSAPANADDEITKIILKACAFEPENRYSSPSEMLAELEVLANSDNNKPERISKVNIIKDYKINSNPEITEFVSSACDKLENFDFETTDRKPEVYTETLQPHYDSNTTTKDILGCSLPESDRTPTSSKKKKVIIACVICAAIILVAITGLLVYNSSSLKNKSPEKEAEIIADILLAEDSTFNKTILNSTYDEMYLAFIDIDLDGVNELLINELNSKNNSSNNSMIKFNTSSVAKEKWMWFGLHVGDFDLVNVEMPSLFADGNGKHYYLFHNRDFISSTEESSIEKIVCDDTTLKGEVVIKSSKTQYNSGKITELFYDSQGEEISNEEYNKAYAALFSTDKNLNMQWKIINVNVYKEMSADEKRIALIELYLDFSYDEIIDVVESDISTTLLESKTEAYSEPVEKNTNVTKSTTVSSSETTRKVPELSATEPVSPSTTVSPRPPTTHSTTTVHASTSTHPYQRPVPFSMGETKNNHYINEWANLNINIPSGYDDITENAQYNLTGQYISVGLALLNSYRSELVIIEFVEDEETLDEITLDFMLWNISLWEDLELNDPISSFGTYTGAKGYISDINIGGNTYQRYVSKNDSNGVQIVYKRKCEDYYVLIIVTNPNGDSGFQNNISSYY